MKGLALAATLSAMIACGQSGAAASASNPPAADPPGDSVGTPAGSRPGGAGRAGGRGATSVVLGPNDVADVTRGPIEDAIAIQGDLKPIEEIAVRARIEGNVEAVTVRAGDRVTKGQVLARFENSNQESARKSAEADLESAKADVANSQWNADQSAELFKAGAIPERDLRTAQQTLVAAQARQAAAEAHLRATTQDFDDTRVLSPTTGSVSVRSVETGEHVARGATVFTIVRNDVLELEAALPARFAGDVRPSQPVRFSAAGRDLDGKVARVSPTINPANRSVSVYLQLPNADGSLKGNTFATGRIITRLVPDAMIIPTAAVRYVQAQSQPFVYRILNDVVDFAPVQLGIINEVAGLAQVIDGLNEGDEIVVGNIGALGRGVKVTIARAPEPGRSRPMRNGGSGRRGGGNGKGRGEPRAPRGGDNPVPKPPG